MSADPFRPADALDRWWDAYQRGEIADGIPLEDMNLIQEITAMHAHAISSADESRVWRRTTDQIERREEDGGIVRRLMRLDIPQVFGWPTGRRMPRTVAVVSIVTIVAIVSLIFSQLTSNEDRPVIFAPGVATPGATPLTGVPMYRGDAARTGVMPGPGPSEAPGVIWQTQLQGSITHQPLLVDGTIYIDDSSGWVYALDALTGALEWQIATSVGGASALAVGNGMVYATASEGTLLALDTANGQELWRDDRARPRFPATVIDDRVVFDSMIESDSGDESGAVITLDAATGEELDQFPIPESFRNLTTISEGVIYGRALSGDVYAYDLASHNQLWRAAVGSYAQAPITIVDAVAFVPLGSINDNGGVVALDAETGAELWRQSTPATTAIGAAIVADGAYYAFAKDGTFYANNAVDGTAQFTEPNFEAGWEVVAAPAFSDGTVFIANQGGTVVGTRGQSGDLWQVALPGRIDSGPIVAGEFLWVGTNEGVLYALGASELAQSATAESASTPAPATPSGSSAQVEWSSYPGLVWSIDVAVDSQEVAYVVDSRNGQIAVIGSDGELIHRIGAVGDAPGEFSFEASDAGQQGGVDIGPDDLIYVADALNNRVQVFDRDYQFLREWGSAGTGEGQFNLPTDILVANDQVYVSDIGNNRVQIFTLDGEFVSQFGSFGTGEGQFNAPADLAADGNGNIYVGEWAGARIQLFRADGTYVGLFLDSSQFIEVWGLDIDPQGNVLAVDAAGGAEKLMVFDPLGNLIAEYGKADIGESGYPVSVAVHTDGSIYVIIWEPETHLIKIRIPEVTGDE